jgi:hypothetical protein
MMASSLYLRIADGLAPEFEVIGSGADGVIVVDDDDRVWRVTAEELPA